MPAICLLAFLIANWQQNNLTALFFNTFHRCWKLLVNPFVCSCACVLTFVKFLDYYEIGIFFWGMRIPSKNWVCFIYGLFTVIHEGIPLYYYKTMFLMYFINVTYLRYNEMNMHFQNTQQHPLKFKLLPD